MPGTYSQSDLSFLWDLKYKTKILNDRQVRIMTHLLNELVLRDTPLLSLGATFFPEDTIRLTSLSARFQQERERLGYTIRHVSQKLKVPQYRIRAVEENRKGDILPEVLSKYASFLGLERWCRRWTSANKDLAEKLGLLKP